jgi:hypothetical protein
MERALHMILLAGSHDDRHIECERGLEKRDRIANRLVGIHVLDQLHRADLVIDQEQGALGRLEMR